MIEINGVFQSFRNGFWMKRVDLLQNIHFTIPKKSVFGFVGPNGAGKTTLIHLLVGIKKPAEGKILYQGQETYLSQVKQKIGYLPERPYFYQFLTGRELLSFFGKLSQMSHQQIKMRTEEVLNEVGMLHAADFELRRYSKGMLQRIGIAQSILHDPEFLVLDEPMSGLDPVGRKEIKELIYRLSQKGRTIFFSSHIIPDVEALCDHLALIEKGKIKQVSSVKELLDHNVGKKLEEIIL